MNFQSNLSSHYSFTNIFEARLNKMRTKSVAPSLGCIYSNNDNCKEHDKDTLRDELVKSKVQYNKNFQDFYTLRIEYKKLEKDYQNVLQLLDDLVCEANRNLMLELKDFVSLNDKDFNKIVLQHISPESSAKILNYNLINKLKHEIYQLREDIKKKDNEIQTLQSKSTILKYKNLDEQFSKTSLELIEVTDKYFRSNQRENDIRNHAEGLIQKLDFCQNELCKTRHNLIKKSRNGDKEKENCGNIIRNHSKEIECDKEHKNKEKNLNILINSYSKKLKNKENELEIMKVKNGALEKIINDLKDKTKKKKAKKKSKDKHLKEDLKIKVAKIKDLENRTLEYYSEIEKLKKSQNTGKNLVKIEKNYNLLKNENIILKEDIEKLKNEIVILKVYVKENQDKSNEEEFNETDNDEHNMKIVSIDNEKKTKENDNHEKNEQDVFITRPILEFSNSKRDIGTKKVNNESHASVINYNEEIPNESKEPLDDAPILKNQLQNEELKRLMMNNNEKDDIVDHLSKENTIEEKSNLGKNSIDNISSDDINKNAQYIEENANTIKIIKEDEYQIKQPLQEVLKGDNNDRDSNTNKSQLTYQKKKNSNQETVITFEKNENKLEQNQDQETVLQMTKEMRIDKSKEIISEKECLLHLNNENEQIIINNINPLSSSHASKCSLYSNQQEVVPICLKNSNDIEPIIDHPSNAPLDSRKQLMMPSDSKVTISSQIKPCDSHINLNNNQIKLPQENQNLQRSLQSKNMTIIQKIYKDLSIEAESLTIRKTFTKIPINRLQKDRLKTVQEAGLFSP